MKTVKDQVEIKLVDAYKHKETHGLYVNGELHYQGTESECSFLRLVLLKKIEIDSAKA
ncbi:hypothetical protein PZB74_13440 [Porifericola rhodea]|uniref:hypothetical protein n=1 Tax=Porifericola rhodea TaxID=930972 RepID=UPI0026662340|nr:hypothetical protein [Porifericola rhodea]WKN29968.1 hypothetical protein PZB74_13440 [Porifericola rhodea]